MDLVRRGRIRRLSHLFVHQLSLSVAVAFGGSILLLLLGTQIFRWYWLLALFAGSLAVGLWRIRSKVPSAYDVACAIDNRLNLKDCLSTAFYFGQHPERATSPREVVENQRDAAEELARTADLHLGIPFAAPRSVYACGALAMAAFGVFAVRYGVTRSLDLRPSLVQIAFNGVLGTAQNITAAKRNQIKQPGGDAKQPGMPVDPMQAQSLDLDPATDAALKTVETPEVNNTDRGPNASQAKAFAKGAEDAPRDPMDSTENGESSTPGSDATAGNSANSDKGGSQSAGEQDPSKNSNQASNGSGENSSLTDKMKDALANLLSKMKMQPKNGEGKQSASNSQNGSQSGQQKGGSKEQNGTPAPGKPQGDGAASPDAQGEQQQNGDQAQTAQGKSNGKSSDHANSQDAKSGIGKQDGDKSAKEAEQLAAMGKISEIFGKRAQNVTGEVMIEVASGKQQLRTQYSQRNATHVEAGGEINRDEVPLAYQQYVQQYFEEIRKLPATKPAKGAPDAKTKPPGT